MLFHNTQRNMPETCPVDEGGSNSLFDPKAEGVELIRRYGTNIDKSAALPLVLRAVQLRSNNSARNRANANGLNPGSGLQDAP